MKKQKRINELKSKSTSLKQRNEDPIKRNKAQNNQDRFKSGTEKCIY